ncbi:small multi-drug export protein [Geoglobus acetivorans]|uniref:Small multi-drug export protein n=1 Tax=Geoglobus acetivorans TaxID=565033 RepID=A0ABZ3H5G3_GEOAI
MEWIDVFVLSMLPVSELRGAIPYAIVKGFSPGEAYIVSVVGNFIPVPLIIFLLGRLDGFFRKLPVLGRIYMFALGLADKRREKVEKYGYLGLTLFVAIPLPVTGAWTGSLIAFLLGMNRVKATLFILAGILIAGIIVLSASTGVWIAYTGLMG